MLNYIESLRVRPCGNPCHAIIAMIFEKTRTPIVPTTIVYSMTNFADRTIWTGDNLDILRGLNSESVDLIYLDPLHPPSTPTATMPVRWGAPRRVPPSRTPGRFRPRRGLYGTDRRRAAGHEPGAAGGADPWQGDAVLPLHDGGEAAGDASVPYRQNRHVLFGQQEARCNGCRSGFPFRNFTVDHIVPESRGGTDTSRTCNCCAGTATASRATDRRNICCPDCGSWGWLCNGV